MGWRSVGRPGASISAKSFAVGLALITLAALVIRVGAALWYDAYTTIEGDAVWFTGVASPFAHGNGFLEPLHLLAGRRVPTAAHPPLYAMYLSLVELAGESGTLIARVWSCLPGTATVLLLGFIGRDVAGRRTGLIAAALGAVSVELFAQDVRLWSEGLYGFTIALTVLCAYRYIHRPDLMHAGLLAGVIALAALTRAEAALLFVILVVPLVFRVGRKSLARRLAALGVAAVVAIVILAPWLIYNNSGRFKHPVGLTTTFGLLIGTSNCQGTYYGERIGDWGGYCLDTLPHGWPEDESVRESVARDAGLTYMSEHLERLPLVIPARLGRSFGFYAPIYAISDELLFGEAHVHPVTYLALAQYWLYLGLGIAGGVTLFRRRVALLPLTAPIVTVAVITVIGYGNMRFRMALDVVLPVLAAVAIDSYLTRRTRMRSASQEIHPHVEGPEDRWPQPRGAQNDDSPAPVLLRSSRGRARSRRSRNPAKPRS